MATAEPIATASDLAEGKLPHLRNGDHLSRDEFGRRYAAMPEPFWAELVEGVVYIKGRVPAYTHGIPHADLVGWLGHYKVSTPGITSAVHATLRIDLENELQPDILAHASDLSERLRHTEDDFLEGAPDFVAEIAYSTASIDLHTKLRVYRRNQVQEYLVWRTLDREFDWFVLSGCEYQRLSPDDHGVLHSRVFPGLRLNVPAMLADDLAAALETVKLGLASPEHAAFVALLASKRVP